MFLRIRPHKSTKVFWLSILEYYIVVALGHRVPDSDNFCQDSLHPGVLCLTSSPNLDFALRFSLWLLAFRTAGQRSHSGCCGLLSLLTISRNPLASTFTTSLSRPTSTPSFLRVLVVCSTNLHRCWFNMPIYGRKRCWHRCVDTDSMTWIWMHAIWLSQPLHGDQRFL